MDGWGFCFKKEGVNPPDLHCTFWPPGATRVNGKNAEKNGCNETLILLRYKLVQRFCLSKLPGEKNTNRNAVQVNFG